MRDQFFDAQFINPLHESLEKFGAMCNMRQLKQSTIILLLNKHEGFVDCLKKVSLMFVLVQEMGGIMNNGMTGMII